MAVFQQRAPPTYVPTTNPQSGSTGVLTFPSNGTNKNGGRIDCLDHLGDMFFGQLPTNGAPTVAQTYTMNGSFWAAPLTGFAVAGNTAGVAGTQYIGQIASLNGATALVPYKLDFTSTFGGALIFCTASSSAGMPTYASGTLTLAGDGARNGGSVQCMDHFGDWYLQSYASTGTTAQTITMSAFTGTGQGCSFASGTLTTAGLTCNVIFDAGLAANIPILGTNASKQLIASTATLPVKVSNSITPAAVTASTCAEQTFTYTGFATGQGVSVSAPAAMGAHVWINGGPRVSATNTLAITWCADATGGTPAAGTYIAVAF